MANVQWNINKWKNHNWEHSGEGWSAPWGTSEAQWFCTLYPRLHSFLPAENILEIGSGRGRWTKYLVGFAEKSIRTVDLVPENVDFCNKLFREVPVDIQCFHNDGLDLSCVCDRKYDFVFSFDSLVHADLTVMQSYIEQIIDKILSPDGICFLHHSNLKFSLKYNLTSEGHARDKTVSAEDVAHIIEKNKGKILCQEIITWGCHSNPSWKEHVYLDALTIFSKSDSIYLSAKNQYVFNPDFISLEAEYCKKVLNNYCFTSKK